MEKTGLTIGLHLLVIICVFLPSTRAADSSREDLIQDSVRRLLGMTPGSDTWYIPRKNTTLPPQYVMDLYEKYRSGHAPMQGNTVRSILPMRDPVGEGEVLIFNLTSISPGEQILQSKLYILKRRKAKSGRRRDLSNFRIKIGSIPLMTSHRYIDVTLTNRKPEWHAYDITESVIQCRQSKKHKDQLLGATLEVRGSKGSYRLVPFRRLLKHNSQPFVLIFSEDSTNKTRGPPKGKPRATRIGLHDLLSAKVDHGALQFENDSSELGTSSELILRKKRSLHRSYNPHTSFVNNENYGFNNESLNELTRIYTLLNDHIYRSSIQRVSYSENDYNVSVFQKLKRFSKLNHKLKGPSEILLHQMLQKVLLNNIVRLTRHESVLQVNNTEMWNVFQRHRRKRSISSSLGSETISQPSKEVGVGINAFQAVDGKHSPLFNSTATAFHQRQNRQRNRRKRKKKKKKRKQDKLPFWWTRHDKKLHAQDHHKMCQKKSLVVDFEKLGWGDWIMSPKSFNAYYCSGGCSFPLIKDAHPSNHAAIQSLVHAMRLGPNVPAPCCVPSETKPLTMLYFDENNSLVLKNYPNMIVQKCACR
ncbi:bone morphogenetic protein 3 [Caerostris extrusa]|uniref:Bone morphogenetic protein 3 n=1 Tax=Caerostris extrusa TaxID=172846 RepID=A0AAV4PEM6_CAEEX|nr:bone morphogenetic protein 3 [Caerostris extrusa]